jgi:hypothetical protein
MLPLVILRNWDTSQRKRPSDTSDANNGSAIFGRTGDYSCAGTE